MSINAPTETKKIAANMSFIGLARIFEISADFDSATSTPARKAPIPTDSPTRLDNKAYPKHKPKTESKRISLCPELATLSINLGIVLAPIVRVPIINNAAITLIVIMLAYETSPTRTMDCKEAIRITAIMSSTINIPRTRIEDSFLIFPISSRILIIIAVLLIDSAAAMKSESIKLSPNEIQTRNITPKERKSSIDAMPIETRPMDFIFAIGNSIPITNNNRIIPISAKVFKTVRSESIPRFSIPDDGSKDVGKNEVHNGDNGPIRIPAKRYPMISGCRVLKKARVTIDAKIIIIARSRMKSAGGRLNGPV